MADWYSIATPFQEERLLEAWSDAPTETPQLCEYILATAKEQVISYAPSTAEGIEGHWAEDPPGSGALLWVPATGFPGVPIVGQNIPERLVLAQLQQAKSIWNAGRGEVGPDGFSFMPRPLEKEIQQMIRPRRGVPNVF